MIVIFGATGKVGGTAARELRRRGRAVRAVVRNPAKAETLAQLGCEVRVADLHDRQSVTAALDGAERVLAICPLRPTADDVLAEAAALVDSVAAALEHTRPEGVVAISDYAAQYPSGTGVTLALHRLEQRLRMLPGMTFVRSSEQMQNWVRQATVARETGVLPSLHHPVTRPFPMVSAYDVGAEAANLLDAPSVAHDGPRIVHFEGPRRRSAEDVARVFASAFGRPVTARATPRDEWAAALAKGGLGASYARLVMELQDAHNAGRVDVEENVGEIRRGTTELELALARIPHR